MLKKVEVGCRKLVEDGSFGENCTKFEEVTTLSLQKTLHTLPVIPNVVPWSVG